jgi:hypothetical protein
MITGMVSAPVEDHSFKQRHAIGIGHPDIEQNKVWALTQSGGARLRRVFRQFDVVTLVIEDFPEQIPNAMLIINNQNICHVLCANP